MKVEFADCELGIGVALYVSGTEFLKADKSKDEFCSLAAATDAFYNQQGLDYHIGSTDYDTVKQWVKASGAVIFAIESDRYGHRKWYEIYVSTDNRYTRIIWSDDGREYYSKDSSDLKKTPTNTTTRQKGGRDV